MTSFVLEQIFAYIFLCSCMIWYNENKWLNSNFGEWRTANGLWKGIYFRINLNFDKQKRNFFYSFFALCMPVSTKWKGGVESKSSHKNILFRFLIQIIDFKVSCHFDAFDSQLPCHARYTRKELLWAIQDRGDNTYHWIRKAII